MRKITILPTLLTLGNAVCGFTAIAIASRITTSKEAEASTCYFVAALLIFGGMVFDALDGYAARLAKSASDFGRELDSLCDAVTFGVAPGFLLLCFGAEWGGNERARQIIAVIAVFYMVCAILRLARYNVETSPDPLAGKRFKGLPSPAAAGCVAALALLRSGYGVVSNGLTTDGVSYFVETWAPLGTLIVALLMVSSIPFPHFTKHLLRRRLHFGVIVQAVLIVFLIAATRGLALALLFWAYALFFPVRWLILRGRRQVVAAESHRVE